MGDKPATSLFPRLSPKNSKENSNELRNVYLNPRDILGRSAEPRRLSDVAIGGSQNEQVY